MSSIYLPYQKSPRWNIDRATIALNCARLGLPIPGEKELSLAMPMWEKAGNKVYDYSGNKRDGTATGTLSDISWIPKGIDFAGDTDTYFLIANSFSFSVSDPWSIFCFVDTDGDGTEAMVVGHNGDNYLRLEGWRTTIKCGGSSYTFNNIDTFAGVATTIIFTSDGLGALASNLSGYQDGKLIETKASTNTGMLLSKIGSGYGDAAHAYDGRIYSFVVFGTCLNPSQAATLHNNPYGMFEPIRKSLWIVPLAPTTVAPTTAAPTTLAPTTTAPTTISPTTVPVATTPSPTTAAPTTAAPTTTAPTTSAPTTIAPTTLAPTTPAPPTTLAPTTVAPPTSLAPTTPTLTTLAPTTAPPETICMRTLNSTITKELSLGSLITKEIRSNGYLC